MRQRRTGVVGGEESDGGTRLAGTTGSTNSTSQSRQCCSTDRGGRNVPVNVVLDLVGAIKVDDVFDVLDI